MESNKIDLTDGAQHYIQDRALLSETDSRSKAHLAFLCGVSLIIAFVIWRIVIKLTKSLGGAESKKKQAVLLLGPCNSGKTLLFYRLLGDNEVTTVSSLRLNSINICDAPCNCPLAQHIKNTNFELVDFPGHTRLAPQAIKLLSRAKAIIYLLDSSDKAMIKQGAEQLYDLFLRPEVYQHETPLLLVCNKSDLPAAKSQNGVLEDVLREIERMRTSRSAVLEGEDEASQFLGVEGKVFRFEDAPIPVSVSGASVSTNEFGQVMQFLTAVMSP